MKRSKGNTSDGGFRTLAGIANGGSKYHSEICFPKPTVSYPFVLTLSPLIRFSTLSTPTAQTEVLLSEVRQSPSSSGTEVCSPSNVGQAWRSGRECGLHEPWVRLLRHRLNGGKHPNRLRRGLSDGNPDISWKVVFQEVPKVFVLAICESVHPFL